MFWKLGDMLKTKMKFTLRYIGPDGVTSSKRFDAGTEVVYLYRHGDYVTVVLKEVFDAKKGEIPFSKRPSVRKLAAVYNQYTAYVPVTWLVTPELRKKGFKYLL